MALSTDVTQQTQQLPFTPPPQVAKNAAGQMLDSSGKPIPQAPSISPDGTSIATGDQGLVWGASGPNMTPPAAPATPSAPSSGGGGGFFSRLGAGISKIAPYIAPAAQHAAAAFGNYKPLQEQRQEDELALQRQGADLQGELANSSMETQELNRQHLSQEIANTRSPEAIAQANLDQQRKLEQDKNSLARPVPFAAGAQSGSGMQQYEQTFNTDTKQWETKPMTVGGQPLLAAPKLKSGPIVDTPSGTAIPYFDQTGHLDHYEHINGVPFSAEETQNVNSTTKNSIQKDVNGNLVNVPESSTVVTKKSRVSPYGAASGGQAAPPPGIVQSPGINQGAPQTKPAIPGAPKTTTATPINGVDGSPLHKPLDAGATKTLTQIAGTENILNSVMPELEARVKQSPTGANSLWDSATQRAAWLEYQHGGIVPSNIDPSLAKLLPVIAQLQIVAGSPYMQGSRNFQFMQQIQQHIPNPEKDSPALMLDKARAMLQTLPQIRKGILQGEGVTEPIVPQGGAAAASPANVEDDFAQWQQSQTPKPMPRVPR